MLATNASATVTGIHDLKSIEASSPWRLRVVGPTTTQTFLIYDGDNVIGRSSEADVRVDDERISRRHANLVIADDRATLTDLGSMNGTRVRDRQMKQGAPVELLTGETFELGGGADGIGVVFVLQRRKQAQKARRQLYDHGYFETRVDEEIARSAALRSAGEDSGLTARSEPTDRPVTLARLHVEPRAGVDLGVVAEVLEEVLPRAVLAAEYAPRELEFLFVAMPWEDVEDIVDKLLARMQQVGAPARAGFGFFPRDGRTASSLMAAANSRLSSDREETVPLVVAPPDGRDRSPMERLQKLVERVAPSDISIVIHGETGVGKEVMAKELHRLSHRAGKPFVGLNCAALTETLLESELFGHERGSFSGAVATKPGLFEVADKGTVFLDEIGETSPAIQAKLLRVLEERTVLRVGGLHPRPIDVRFLAASHKDLEDEVAAGRFRQDLYFRLNGITLEIPPLRERTGEIEGLVTTFVADACRRGRRAEVPTLSREAAQLLKSYAWPGNIRELRNVIERAVLLCSGPRITPEQLPADRMARTRAPPPPPPPPEPVRRPTAPPRPAEQFPRFGDDDESDSSTRPSMNRLGVTGERRRDDGEPDPATLPPLRRPDIESLKGAVSDLERERIIEALRICGGNQTKAADMLGISRRTLLNRLDQFNLPRPRKGV
jgi:DNA-binding NtrC family response regulator